MGDVRGSSLSRVVGRTPERPTGTLLQKSSPDRRVTTVPQPRDKPPLLVTHFGTSAGDDNAASDPRGSFQHFRFSAFQILLRRCPSSGDPGEKFAGVGGDEQPHEGGLRGNDQGGVDQGVDQAE